MVRLFSIALALTLAFGVASGRAEAPVASAPPSGQGGAPTVTVFAAASLKNALDAASTAFKAKTGVELKISYASSMALAKQIESGAPAELFVSADEASMDYLAGKNLIKADTRANLLGNALVMVAPRSSKLEKLAFTKEAFKAAIESGKIATGDPASVPVGKYAKAALQKLGLWEIAEPKLALTDNVRSALMFVARDEAPLGVVYLTDAKAEPKVKIVASFPTNSHPPIVYPIALTASAQGDGPTQLLAFLKSTAAKALFVEQGFTFLN
jgi:molybdate transport system substrate-binding protein